MQSVYNQKNSIGFIKPYDRATTILEFPDSIIQAKSAHGLTFLSFKLFVIKKTQESAIPAISFRLERFERLRKGLALLLRVRIGPISQCHFRTFLSTNISLGDSTHHTIATSSNGFGSSLARAISS